MNAESSNIQLTTEPISITRKPQKHAPNYNLRKCVHLCYDWEFKFVS